MVALLALIIAIHQIRYETALVRFSELTNMRIIRKDIRMVVSEKEFDFMLNECRSIAPYSPIFLINAANYAAQNQKWVKMEIYLQEALQKSPERASLYYKLSQAQFRLGKYPEARKNLQKAANLFPNAYQKKYEMSCLSQ